MSTNIRGVNQGIKQFYSQAVKKGFSRDFQLIITQWQFQNQPLFLEDELVFIKTIDLPSKKIENVEAPYMGLKFNVPGVVTYPGSSNWSVTFYADANLDLRTKLEAAMDLTYNNYEDNTSIIDLPGAANLVELSLINENLEIIRRYKLVGAYITEIGSINYKTTGNGSIQEIKTTIAYQYWGADESNASLKTYIQQAVAAQINKTANAFKNL